jgi:trehalose 6-phosphate phosphatase
LPLPQRDWAYFLDIDGTLVEIASRPAAVRVSRETQRQVRWLFAATGGAVALISGRALEDMDRLLPGLMIPAAGQHGLERRDGRGRIWRLAKRDRTHATVRARLTSLVEQHRPLILEDKGLSFAVHFRAAPRLEPLVERILREVQAELCDDYVIQPGKHVAELRPKGADKGDTIRAFLNEPPFRGRIPAFIGDDVTDEAGFDVVNAAGGHSVKVGEGPTRAHWRLRDSTAVMHWLAGAVGAGQGSTR